MQSAVYIKITRSQMQRIIANILYLTRQNLFRLAIYSHEYHEYIALFFLFFFFCGREIKIPTPEI